MRAHDETTVRFAPGLGHLLRDLRLLESLYFQRPGGERFYMTLVNARLGRLGLALDVPRVGKLIVAVSTDDDRLRFHVCREPSRELLSIETAPFEPLSVEGTGGASLRITTQRAGRDELTLRLDIPAVGTATITFHLHRDRVRAAITADKAIRVLPTRHTRRCLQVGQASVPA
jgi:hypothetical protein